MNINNKNNQGKSKQIIYDLVQGNLIPTFTPLNTTKEYFDTLKNIYEKKGTSEKRELKNKLWNLTMEKDEIVASFFTNVSQVREQLTSIGVVMDEDDLIQTLFYGLPSSWETFLVVVNGQEVQPNFERLCDDYL